MGGKNMKYHEIIDGLKLQRFAEENDDLKEDVDDDAKDGESGENNDPEPEKKYTDEDVDEIVAKKFAKWKAKEEEAVKAAKEEAEKLAKMNTEQKQKYKMEQLEAENEQLRKEAKMLELSKTATGLLKEKGIDATAEMLEFVVTDEAESTQKNIDKLVNIINGQLERADRERAKGTPPPAFSGDGDKEITKEEFARMDYQQMRELKASNPDLYRKLASQ